jgi:hypothetical protein
MKKLAVVSILLTIALLQSEVNAQCSKKVNDNGFLQETLDVYFKPDMFGPKPHALDDWCYDKTDNHLFVVIRHKGESEVTAKDLAKSIGQDILMTSRTMKQVNQPISPLQKHVLSEGITVIITWPGRKDPAALEKIRP